MEKLMKYVEEMQKEGISISRPRFQEYYLLEMMIVSKHYGLVSWLVENDKINGKKFYEKNILKGFITITKEEKADSIIMNLSISNTPIDDLISYLK